MIINCMSRIIAIFHIMTHRRLGTKDTFRGTKGKLETKQTFLKKKNEQIQILTASKLDYLVSLNFQLC
jgi:hypothetical protein